MTEILITFAMLTAATLMLGALSFWRGLTSRLVFVVMSVAILAFCALTLLTERENPYLLYVALVLAFMAVLLVLAALYLMIFIPDRPRTSRRDNDQNEPSNGEVGR